MLVHNFCKKIFFVSIMIFSLFAGTRCAAGSVSGPASGNNSPGGVLSGTPDQGSVSSPVQLIYPASFDYNALIADGYAYFRVTGLAPGHNYTISAIGTSDNIDIYYYDVDSTFTTWTSYSAYVDGNVIDFINLQLSGGSPTTFYLKVVSG